MNVDPGTKRFLSLLLAPLFLLLKGKLGIEVPESVQDLMLVGIITYVGGSHAKEAVIARAEAAAGAAALKVTPGADADAIVDAAAKVTP